MSSCLRHEAKTKSLLKSWMMFTLLIPVLRYQLINLSVFLQFCTLYQCASNTHILLIFRQSGSAHCTSESCSAIKHSGWLAQSLLACTKEARISWNCIWALSQWCTCVLLKYTSTHTHSHLHTHVLEHSHTCACTHKHTDVLHNLHPGVSACKRPIPRQSDHTAEASPGLFLCLVRISPGRNGNFILQGLILAWASGKFLLNDHKLRKGKEFV